MSGFHWACLIITKSVSKSRNDESGEEQDSEIKKLRAGLTSLSNRYCLLFHLIISQARS